MPDSCAVISKDLDGRDFTEDRDGDLGRGRADIQPANVCASKPRLGRRYKAGAARFEAKTLRLLVGDGIDFKSRLDEERSVSWF